MRSMTPDDELTIVLNRSPRVGGYKSGFGKIIETDTLRCPLLRAIAAGRNATLVNAGQESDKKVFGYVP
ncbi:MAG: hypothetical protein ABJI96_08600 [Paracoccaceae bacterium]